MQPPYISFKLEKEPTITTARRTKMHRSTITTQHSRTSCYRLVLVTSLFCSTLLYHAEFVRSQDYLQFSNSSSLIADKSRFFLPNSPASSSFNENNRRNSSSALIDGRDPLTESLLSSRESSNSFHDTAAVDGVPLLREPRQFVYDANPWSSSASAGAGSGNLLNVNSNSRNSGSRNEYNSNSRTSSVPGDVRRNDNAQPSQRRNGNSRSASSSSQPASSPWDTDNTAYEGSGSNAAGSYSSQQSNINHSPRSGASSAGNSDQWPQTSSIDNQRSSSSLYDRNNRQRYPSSSQVRPSASSYSPQNTSPWGSSETTGSRSGAGANAAVGGTTEDDEDDEWDNVEGSGDTAHDQTDPFDTASGAGGRSPTSSSANNGFNLVGQPPSTSANDNWQLPSSNSRPGEDRNRQPAGGDNANNYDSSLTSGARIPSPVLRKDESRTSSGQQYPSGAGYDDSNNYHENFDERNNNDNPNPSWGQSPYDELPSSSSSTTLMPIALPPAVGPGASGGGIISSNTADEGDGEDEDSTIKPVEIPTNTVYRGSEGTAKTDGGDASRRSFSSQRPNNTTGDLVSGGVGGANGTELPPTTETPQPPSWAWLSAMALQFFDSFWQKMTEEPGLLAAVIGGAVIGLLCAILLAMFLIYRMRKKDEGSYALDESTVYRKPGGYMRAPTSEVTAKEYYA